MLTSERLQTRRRQNAITFASQALESGLSLLFVGLCIAVVKAGALETGAMVEVFMQSIVVACAVVHPGLQILVSPGVRKNFRGYAFGN